ncbi:MAG: ureidoglycolate lyase [Beijerinckiaceae bacterium]
MHTLTAQPLTAAAFAPYGHVTESPALGARNYMDANLVNRRPVAGKASLSIACIEPRTERPLPLSVIERHVFSSQSFVPLNDGRYLVLVAPKRPDGSADVQQAQAFLAAPGQSITYSPDIWHGPMTPLDQPMHFAIMMFNDGTSGDEEVIRHDAPFAMLTF